MKNGELFVKRGSDYQDDSYALAVEVENGKFEMDNMTLHGGIALYDTVESNLKNTNFVMATNYYAIYLEGGAKATINGGKFESNGNNPILYADKSSSVLIDGGSYYGKIFDGKGLLNINGGYFSEDPNNLLNEGYTAIQEEKNGKQMYHVVKGARVANESEFANVVSDSSSDEKVDVYVLNDIQLSSSLTISRNCNIIGNSNSILSSKSITVSAKDVTFRNLGFADPTNSNSNASSVYIYSPNEYVEFINCYFEDNQWDAIQSTTKDGKRIVVSECVFKLAEDRENCHRFIHIEPRDINGNYTQANTEVVINNNKFYASQNTCGDSLITIYGPLFENMDIRDNQVIGEIELTNSYSNGNIWISNGISSEMWDSNVGFTVIKQQTLTN